MELDDNYFKKLKEYKENAKRNISFFYQLANEYKNNNGKYFAYTLTKRAERIENCINYWEWNKYILNNVKELRLVNRCKDLFCQNCRIVNISKAIINFMPAFNRMIPCGYTPYHLVLTVPNIYREYLSDEIKKMNIAFAKLWRWIYQDFNKNGSYYGGYKDRLFEAVGAVRVLELTVQKSDLNYLHVHFHVILFLNNAEEELFFKYIEGGYQYRSNRYIYYSDADIEFQKLWRKAYDNKNIKEIKNTSDDWHDNYICNIDEVKNSHGLYEVFKYCFKDIDIKNLEIFKCLLLGLRGKRIRQGYGALYNIKVDDRDLSDDELASKDDICSYLEFKDEIPVIVANNFRDNFEKDMDYKKVSIFKKN